MENYLLSEEEIITAWNELAPNATSPYTVAFARAIERLTMNKLVTSNQKSQSHSVSGELKLSGLRKSIIIDIHGPAKSGKTFIACLFKQVLKQKGCEHIGYIGYDESPLVIQMKEEQIDQYFQNMDKEFFKTPIHICEIGALYDPEISESTEGVTVQIYGHNNYVKMHIACILSDALEEKGFTTIRRSVIHSEGVPNPMHFGNMAWKPEMTLVLPLHRNGANSKELTVQPSFLHTGCKLFHYENVSDNLLKTPITIMEQHFSDTRSKQFSRIRFHERDSE